MLQPTQSHNLSESSINPFEEDVLFTTTPERRPLGYTLRSVEVPDISDGHPEFEYHHEAFRLADEELARNPEWASPLDRQMKFNPDPDNRISASIYGDLTDDPNTMREWLERLVPSALALETLALKTNTLPTTDVEIDQNAFDIYMFSADARSIRTRGALMAELLVGHASEKDPNAKQNWLSLACGAARPVLEAAARVKGESAIPIDVTLVDYDPNVLEYSAGLADSMDAVVGHQEIESDLRRTMIAGDALVQEFGEESKDVVDILGFLEYCRDNAAVRMLRNSYRLTAPGGVMITANMRDDRPERNLHERGIGWPGVQMRSADELVELAIKAGIDPSEVEAYQPVDGVYTVLKVTKPQR